MSLFSVDESTCTRCGICVDECPVGGIIEMKSDSSVPTPKEAAEKLCISCGHCVSVCPYSAPKFNANSGKAEIQSTLCKGCGLCVASCRSGAIHLKGFDTSQIMAMLTSCLWEEAPFETTFS